MLGNKEPDLLMILAAAVPATVPFSIVKPSVLETNSHVHVSLPPLTDVGAVNLISKLIGSSVLNPSGVTVSVNVYSPAPRR